ncbi:hypothetical protein NE237_001598 [Protea cynaroides]|uniref:Secreted protein n=1 Tax=Protea cynaroides TaxID=273540 RepID=A0A9Q0KTE7_9MAGN|nr:hypothetical protein NE237_001598 [Protea cynaroides]
MILFGLSWFFSFSSQRALVIGMNTDSCLWRISRRWFQHFLKIIPPMGKKCKGRRIRTFHQLSHSTDAIALLPSHSTITLHHHRHIPSIALHHCRCTPQLEI